MKNYFLKNLSCFFIFIALLANSLAAQPFANEIASFKKNDSFNFPPSHEILFVGSSSFTKWTDVQDYFPSFPIINRGFGGSTLPDVIFYANDIIFPYQPRQIVIYCGENDIASSDTVTAQLVLARFKTLFKMIRQKIPDVPVVFVSLKPSPSRWHLRIKMIEANRVIKKYLKRKKHTGFVNVWPAMLDTDGKPLKQIFTGDNLHMNASGYAIWQKLIEPFLKK